MVGEGSSCTESSPPGPTDGQPHEEATWQGHVVVKRSSLGFIFEMLLGWQEHTCLQQECLAALDDCGREVGVVALLSAVCTHSQTSEVPLAIMDFRGN